MTFDKATPDRIYATPSQEWSPFAGEPAVEYIKASKVQTLVEALDRISYQPLTGEMEQEGDIDIGYDCIIGLAREALAAFKEGR